MRLPLLLIALSALAGDQVRCAYAHGGSFREQELDDVANPRPTNNGPPPPPSVTTPRAGANPDQGDGASGGSGGGPNVRGNGSLAGDRLGRSGRTQGFTLDWRTWWVLNRWDLLPPVEREAEAVTTRSEGFFDPTRDPGALAELRQRKLLDLAQSRVEPLLERLTDPSAPEQRELLAAALIAWARMATSARAPEHLRAWAERRDASIEVRESAVLGLGLLRRDEPNQQLGLHEVTRIRDLLFGVFDDDKTPTRVRAFAALSLGLLGDQPHHPYMPQAHGLDVKQRLHTRLKRRYANAELPIALTVALGMQPAANTPRTMLNELHDIVVGRRVYGRGWDGLERAFAMAALRGLDAEGWPSLAMRMSGASNAPLQLRASAVETLGHGAHAMDDNTRQAAALMLHQRIRKEPHWLVRGLLYTSMGRILRADVVTGDQRLHRAGHVLGRLIRALSGERNEVRPFAALAMASAARELELATLAHAQLVRTAQRSLVKTLDTARGSDQVVAAHALATGLVGMAEAQRWLEKTLGNPNRSNVLRAQCALALGLSARPAPAVLRRLRRAATERRSALVHLRSVEALARLGDPEAPRLLAAEMEKTRSQSARATLALALGRLRSPDAALHLLAILDDPDGAGWQHTMAVVALGLTFDPNPATSRRRAVPFVTPLSLSPALQQLFNIL